MLYNDDDFFETLEEEQDFDAVALAVVDEKTRMRLFFELGEEVLLPPFVHPTAVVSSHASVGGAHDHHAACGRRIGGICRTRRNHRCPRLRRFECDHR